MSVEQGGTSPIMSREWLQAVNLKGSTSSDVAVTYMRDSAAAVFGPTHNSDLWNALIIKQRAPGTGRYGSTTPLVKNTLRIYRRLSQDNAWRADGNDPRFIYIAGMVVLLAEKQKFATQSDVGKFTTEQLQEYRTTTDPAKKVELRRLAQEQMRAEKEQAQAEMQVREERLRVYAEEKGINDQIPILDRFAEIPFTDESTQEHRIEQLLNPSN